MATVHIKRVRDSAILPTRATPSAAGFDLYAAERTVIEAGKIARVPLGVALELQDSTCAQVLPRSGLTLAGIIVQTGLIDSDYRGEICATVWNTTAQRYEVAPGQRIAQLLVLWRLNTTLVVVPELGETERGAGGYGSTGHGSIEMTDGLGNRVELTAVRRYP